MSTIIFFEIFNSYLQTASKNFIKFKRHVHILYSSYNNVCFFVFFSIIYNIYFDHVRSPCGMYGEECKHCEESRNNIKPNFLEKEIDTILN